MDEEKSYSFTEYEFKQMASLADSIYNIGIVLKAFCSVNTDIEEIQNLSPVLIDMQKSADLLNSIFINYDR